MHTYTRIRFGIASIFSLAAQSHTGGTVSKEDGEIYKPINELQLGTSATSIGSQSEMVRVLAKTLVNSIKKSIRVQA